MIRVQTHVAEAAPVLSEGPPDLLTAAAGVDGSGRNTPVEGDVLLLHHLPGFSDCNVFGFCQFDESPAGLCKCNKNGLHLECVWFFRRMSLLLDAEVSGSF